ncbi:olfactory receptor 2M5-like [Trichechus manatus latirostris]|uniref:Olfactory receptor n=1 Tax=Trichechus manatus latirostris TaxID=127582 RepID=A0A2Y9E4U9_TRIMA|nr:olfactory receptor 2M5-like [Trichechus manatus latirostris]
MGNQKLEKNKATREPIIEEPPKVILICYQVQINETSGTDFILLGLSFDIKHINLFIGVMLLIYIVALILNSILILLIWMDSYFHKPMYFLLSQVALMDLILISSFVLLINFVSKMPINFFSGRRNISRSDCGTQIFFFLTLGIAECILITLMSYDRYVAICNPLRYVIIMSHRVCVQMAAFSWAGGVITSLVHSTYAMHFPTCGSREISPFLCELTAVLKLACEDISAYERAVVVTSIMVLLISLSLIFSSFALIFLAILHMNSPEGRNKALTTCSSHLSVVCLYYGPAIVIYMRLSSYHNAKLDQVLFILGPILTPMLNSLIYSLRNKEVVWALRKVLG